MVICYSHCILTTSQQTLTGRLAQSVRCLTADTCLTAGTCLTADPAVTSSNTARSHTSVEIDHEIIYMVIFLPFTDVASYKRMYVHEVLVNRLVKRTLKTAVVLYIGCSGPVVECLNKFNMKQLTTRPLGQSTRYTELCVQYEKLE